MNCSDHYGEDWGDVTGEKQEAIESALPQADGYSGEQLECCKKGHCLPGGYSHR